MCRCIILTTTYPKWHTLFSSASKLFFFFCRDSAIFICQTLYADFKYPIQNWDRVPNIRVEWVTCPLLFFYFNFITYKKFSLYLEIIKILWYVFALMDILLPSVVNNHRTFRNFTNYRIVISRIARLKPVI